MKTAVVVILALGFLFSIILAAEAYANFATVYQWAQAHPAQAQAAAPVKSHFANLTGVGAGVAMLCLAALVVIYDNAERAGAKRGQNAIQRILHGAEREMHLTSARHQAALDDIRWRNRRGETNQ